MVAVTPDSHGAERLTGRNDGQDRSQRVVRKRNNGSEVAQAAGMRSELRVHLSTSCEVPRSSSAGSIVYAARTKVETLSWQSKASRSR